MDVSFVVVSVLGGFLFGTMDGLINANPYAMKLFAVYQPLAKTEINVRAGIVIDLAYGFAMAGLFVVLYDALPGDIGLMKGLGYGLIVWFFRVLMSAITTWMTLRVPIKALSYLVLTGLAEMLVLGALFGLTLNR